MRPLLFIRTTLAWACCSTVAAAATGAMGAVAANERPMERSIERFIQSARTEVGASADAPSTAALRGVPAWFEELQIRQKTNSGLNPYASAAAPAYELRLMPKAWGQRVAEQTALGWRAEQQAAQTQAALASALRRRYQAVLDWLSQQATTVGLLQSAQLLESEVKLNRSVVAARDFNIKRLLDAEVALARTQGQAEIALLRLNELRVQLELPAHTAQSLQAESATSASTAEAGPAWVTPQQVRWQVLQTVDTQQMPAVQALRLQWARLAAEDEIAQSRQRLGVAALSVERFNGERGFGASDKRTQFAVSLNIPLGGDGYKAIDTRLAARAAELAYQQRLIEDTHALAGLKTEALAAVQAWEVAQAGLQRQAARLGTAAPKTDPELALALRQEEARQQRDMATLEYKVRAVYVQYLFTTGVLAQAPLRNWIAQGMPLLGAD
jgi:hypothetical protein